MTIPSDRFSHPYIHRSQSDRAKTVQVRSQVTATPQGVRSRHQVVVMEGDREIAQWQHSHFNPDGTSAVNQTAVSLSSDGVITQVVVQTPFPEESV